MGTLRGYSLLVFVALPLTASAQSSSNSAYPLSQALITGAVSVQFHSTGASSGDSVLLTISKSPGAGDAPFFVMVPSGTRLENVSGTGQSMVLAGVRAHMVGANSFMPASRIELSDSKPQTYLLAAYCAEFSKENPSPQSTFTVGDIDQNLSCILNDASTQRLSIQATQAAVWIYTDRVGFQTVQHKFQVGAADWAAASSVAQQCLTANGTGQPSFNPQQASMQSGGQSSDDPGTTKPGMQEKSFYAWDPGYGSGALYISTNSVRFVSQDKHGNPTPKYSWATSCDQIVKWKSDPWHLPGPPYEVQLWVKEGYKEHRIRTNQKESYRGILEGLSQACGR